MSVGVMKDYQLRDLRTSHTLKPLKLVFLFFFPSFLFSQAVLWITDSAQWPGRTRSPAAPGPGPATAAPLAERVQGALGVPQTAWVCRGWAMPMPKSFPRLTGWGAYI
jgi:hypothetical protein